MNTRFLLMAQYGGVAVIPLETVCRDYFTHLTPDKLASKMIHGQVRLPLVRMEADNKKAARGVHLHDLAAWLDERRDAAMKELKQLTG